MTTTPAPICTFPVCKSAIRHPSGRCAYHRKPTGLPPRNGAWASGFGLVHPDGGYDEKVERANYVAYVRNDALHRIDGPAYVVLREPFYGYGVRRPSQRGKKALETSVEEWFIGGVHHRGNGPAVTHFYPDTTTKSRLGFYDEGRLHRIDGPALTTFTKHGKVNREVYALAGMVVEEKQFADALEGFLDGAPIEWIRAFADGVIVP